MIPSTDPTGAADLGRRLIDIRTEKAKLYAEQDQLRDQRRQDDARLEEIDQRLFELTSQAVDLADPPRVRISSTPI